MRKLYNNNIKLYKIYLSENINNLRNRNENKCSFWIFIIRAEQKRRSRSVGQHADVLPAW